MTPSSRSGAARRLHRRRDPEGVDLALGAGRIVTVAGTNGAGKSTLAKAIAGLLPHVTGDILVEGRSIRAEPAERRGPGIGYVPQVANVFGALTVGKSPGRRVGSNRRQRIDDVFGRFPALGAAPARLQAACPAASGSSSLSPGRLIAAPRSWSWTSRPPRFLRPRSPNPSS